MPTCVRPCGILANMADHEQLKRILEGAVAWNEWRELNLTKPDLSNATLINANLSNANLSTAELRSANLINAKLSGADLTGAKLIGADLRGADLTNADLTGADLTEAKLKNVNLTGADLTKTQLTRAVLLRTRLSQTLLTEADLSSAILGETTFVDTDLKQTLGLTSCEHMGPSVIDHRTLIRSAQLPITFLRGCGLPDTLIEYLPSLLNHPIQFYSCFISYSTADQTFADRLYADLQHHGVRCWFAPHHIQAGKKIHTQLDEAIRVFDRLLLILSEASMESAWVKTEIAHARQKEINEQRQVLFPISLVSFSRIRHWKLPDADTGTDSAREIRELFIPDFSNWKHQDQYQKAFDGVLRSLKQGDA